MGQPAAKAGDRIEAKHNHIVQMPDGSVVPTTFEFAGPISGTVSTDVTITGQPAAFVGSTADNAPRHVLPPGAVFPPPPPSETAVVESGSQTVMINGKPAARDGDRAVACGLSGGKVVAEGTVYIA